MRIVVMSDTHMDFLTDEFRVICNRYCEGAELVIHLGDWTSNRILNFMEQYPLEAVSGNMDDYGIRDRLPDKKVVQAGGFKLGLIHGWGPPFEMRTKLYNEFTGVDAILFGHTHQAIQLEENGIFWFNPGSVSMGRGSSPRSIGILDVRDRLEGQIIPL